MNNSPRILAVVFVTALLAAGSKFASAAGLQGRVTNAERQPVASAQIQIEGAGGAKLKTLQTDSSGHYSVSGLTSGTFNVVLSVNGVVKAYIANVATNEGETSTLNFELQGANKARPYTKGKHYIMAGPQTGTNTQQWIEVDDRPQNNPAYQERINRSGGDQIKRIQDNAGTAGQHP